MNLTGNLQPVRLYTEADPYYYTVDNRPLTDLVSRDDQLAAAVDTLNANIGGADVLTVTGTANAITITVNNPPSVTANITGNLYKFKALFANTGAVTLMVSPRSAVAVTDNFGNPLLAGAIPVAGYVCLVQATSTGFVLLNPATLPELKQPFSGRIRTMTPYGGALMREWADITAGTVSTTVGAIEYGLSYNCDIDAAGNWLGRDITDVCWVSKYSDVNGVYQLWFAPSAGAGVVPVWTKMYELNPVSGTIYSSGPLAQNFSGLIRDLTPVGGARVREYADITTGTVSTTTGNIEFATIYNAAIDAAGNWLGRDVADICWMEKWSDVGGIKEYWFAATAAAGIVPTWTKLASIDLANGVASLPSTVMSGSLSQTYSGLIRDLTPIGGARIREYSDILTGTVSTTTGNIEFAMTFNAPIDPLTGNWLGRDFADICWMEKWTDVGGVKEYWYAPSAAAGILPTWTLLYTINMATGIPVGDNSTRLSTTAFVQSTALSIANASSSTAINTYCLGIGQAWGNYTGARIAAAVYTNTTTKAIMVNIQMVYNMVPVLGTVCTGSVYVNGVIAGIATVVVGYTGAQNVSVIVPPGATYQFVLSNANTSISHWAELR